MKNIAVIGTGVIGTGWILRFLANGIKVKAFDINSQQLHFLKEEITRTNLIIKKLYNTKITGSCEKPIFNTSECYQQVQKEVI